MVYLLHEEFQPVLFVRCLTDSRAKICLTESAEYLIV
jgi:hypothetical protein